MGGFARQLDAGERAFLGDLLALANEPEPTSAMLYAACAKWTTHWLRQEDGSFAPYIDGVGADDEPEALAEVIEHLHASLETVLKQPNNAWRTVIGQTSTEWAALAGIAANYVMTERGRLTVEARPAASGWRSLIGIGVALLMDTSRPWGRRLRRCRCKSWFLSLTTPAGGRPRKFCSDACYTAAEKQRER